MENKLTRSVLTEKNFESLLWKIRYFDEISNAMWKSLYSNLAEKDITMVLEYNLTDYILSRILNTVICPLMKNKSYHIQSLYKDQWRVDIYDFNLKLVLNIYIINNDLKLHNHESMKMLVSNILPIYYHRN